MEKARVIWREGMYLSPETFQQQDQYHESHLHAMTVTLHPYAWGVRRAIWDRDGLANNCLRAEDLSLVFQDGTIYDAPQGDALPDPVELDTLPPTETAFTFHAGLPARRDPLAPSRLQLLAPAIPRDAFVSLPVVRVVRDPSGGFRTDAYFMAPSVSVRAAGGLHALLRRLLDTLRAKVDALYRLHSEPRDNVIELRIADASSFWMLHTISMSLAMLEHYERHPRLHPERVFEQLLGLAGGLMAYSKNRTHADLPDYDHADPGPGFARLYAIVRELIETVVSPRYIPIPLSKVKPSYHAGRFESYKITPQSTLYLCVSADVPAAELISGVSSRFKVGAPDDVEESVLVALPGLELVHMSQVPAALPMRPNTCYFALGQNSPKYANLMKARTIWIYTADGFPNLALELIALSS
ncbi:type VI secretion system baseplate subunit TssK [Massilia horti]|uniref:Type VI secretion system baseplate subunit TssK n=1 Tax=Massilia horti TaxID=2562153 RepID=A0A4Y9T488_9BURK|nr:type VI secretion system baseplate subunit TssK [Massilia horti]TFW31770.1 type VI secretion system baseplate subunit TssK [Massilia horti]